jgi:hypothetical protein
LKFELEKSDASDDLFEEQNQRQSTKGNDLGCLKLRLLMTTMTTGLTVALTCVSEADIDRAHVRRTSPGEGRGCLSMHALYIVRRTNLMVQATFTE